MNTKTTLLLASLLLGLVMVFIAVERQSARQPAAASSTPDGKESGVARNLLSEPLGGVVKVVARRGGEEWVFEKKVPAEGGMAVWQMTKPAEVRALSQEVDRIAREAENIQYEISYKSGEGSISAADAGLSPPQSTITLTNDAGKSATIEIGKPVSENETYVRKGGDETIVVAKSNLRKLLKPRALEYRDLQLWNFVPENVTRADICETPDSPDSKPACYGFVRDGTRWMMDKPVTAKATAKVDEMLKAVARLRVTQWLDDDAAKLKVYNLDPGSLQIALTVEETVPTDKKDAAEAKDDKAAAEEAPPAPPEKRAKHYDLRVSNRGPIGEDAKVFVRSGDDNAVATIFKSAADKFKPVMNEWRDMQVLSADATGANRIELNVGGQTATLSRKDEQWSFEGDGSQAESHAVSELLAGIKGLKAVSFVEGADAGPAPSFDSPQADIRLTIPGVEAVERITVGGYTDPAKKLLVYVRRGDSGPIAKVKASDITALTKPPSSLRDRTIFAIYPEGISRLVITRPNAFLTGDHQSLTLEKTDNTWTLTAPSKAPARMDEVTKLVNSLATLKAEAIVADARELTAYGLNEPAATVAITFAPAAKDDADKPSAETATKNLVFAEQDGRIYASLGGGSPIYEVNKAVYDQLRAEFRMSETFDFEPKDAQRLTLKTGDESNSFLRKDGKWVFENEPDLPIDSAKVDKILTDVKSIKIDRFASYASDPPKPYGLDQPQFELSLALDPKSTSAVKAITLRASEKSTTYTATAPSPAEPGAKPAPPQATAANFATLAGHEGVFLLNADTVKKIFLPLADLEKK